MRGGRTSPGFWQALETLPTGAAVTADWRRAMDGEFELGREFLKLTQEQSEYHPCQNRPSCGFPHRVPKHTPTRLWAVAEAGGAECLPFKVEPHDLLVYAVDKVKFCGAVARAFKFESTPDGGGFPGAPNIWPVGTYAATRSPVYFCLPGDLTLANIEGLISAQNEAFILFATSERQKSATVQSLLQRQRCEFIPLANSLTLDGKGRFKVMNSIQPMLDRFTAGLAEGNGLARTVEKIGRDLDAVARNQYELRKENDELRQLNKDGYFNFAVRVKGDDFLAFAVIMALGNRKAAADHLKIPHRSFYDRVDQWEKRGKDYQLMLRYMEWRKRSSRHLKVELTPSLQSGESGDQPENPETMADVLTEIDAAADSKDYPALLADLLQALERQNAGNWKSVRDELLTIIKEDLPQ
jgi:hypothetical protein